MIIFIQLHSRIGRNNAAIVRVCREIEEIFEAPFPLPRNKLCNAHFLVTLYNKIVNSRFKMCIHVVESISSANHLLSAGWWSIIQHKKEQKDERIKFIILFIKCT